MIVVIIAGGSGSRLWPLSTPDYPKHLLKLSGEKSLVQDTYQRAKKLSKKIYVVTEIGHAHYIREQLPDLPEECLIVEPARRGTASCIVAGLVRVSQHNGNGESVAFMPADNYIRDVDGFAHTFKLADKIAQREKRIVLVGVEPNYPATGFGYIEKGKLFDEDSFVFNVRRFKEKPDYKTAQQFVKSGNYLWNCGCFVATTESFLTAMKTYAPKLLKEYDDLYKATGSAACKEVYLGFENIAIDYALIEKTDDLLVVPAAFDWMDLGSYGELHDAAESDHQGNHLTGPLIEIENVSNSYIHNEGELPVAVIGLDNVAVINTPNGILVTRKDLAQKVKDVSQRFKES